MKWTFEVEAELDTNSSVLAMDWFDNKLTGMESIYYTQKVMDELVEDFLYDCLCCHPTSDEDIKHITHDEPEELSNERV
jgi:hypothetical protein